MKLFGSKLSYLGIDIGSSGVKLVELLNEGGRPKLATYGYIEEPVDIVRNDSAELIQKASVMIKKLIKEAAATSTKVVSALPSFSVFSSVISMPQMSKKDLAEAIVWEAKKFVPLPVEEMVLDWKILQEGQLPKTGEDKNQASGLNANNRELLGQLNGARERNVKVLLTAAPKNLVDKFVKIYQASELDLISLETDAFSLERSLVGNDHSPIMIIDVGAISTDITIVEKGIPLLNRSVDVGGDTITKAIMRSLNIDLKRAEQFKRDVGFSETSNSGVIPKVIEGAISTVVNEIKYCFDLYVNQPNSRQAVEKIILTGGSSFLPNLPAYLSKLLEIKVYIGDPWARIIYPVELKEVLEEIGPRFAVAIGLAMREIV